MHSIKDALPQYNFLLWGTKAIGQKGTAIASDAVVKVEACRLKNRVLTYISKKVGHGDLILGMEVKVT